MLALLQFGYATDYDYQNNVRSLCDFGLLLFCMFAIAVAIVIVVMYFKRRRLHRLTNPRKDYYR